ncbi:MAG TPA: HNH endonuclease [Ignavibacteria bacterium]
MKRKYYDDNKKTTWDDGSNETKDLKSKISYLLHLNQGFKCAYCERYLIAEDKEMDHIDSKKHNKNDIYTCINIVYSCGYCNSSARKGQNSIVNLRNVNYKLNSFIILHPYLDNPEEHIIFQDEDQLYLDLPRCTEKGKETIKIFHFNDDEMNIFRASTLKTQRENPIANHQLSILIKKAVAYKRK